LNMTETTLPADGDLNTFLGAEARPWYRRPRYLIAAAGGLAVLLILVALAGGGSKASYASEAARRADLTVTVSATGNLQPTKKVEVGSEQSGLVDAVYVDNNDQVTKGQPLARLDPSRLKDALVQSQASLASARAQVAQYQASQIKANSDLNREEDVYRMSGGKVPAKTELDNARAQARQASAQLRAAQAQVVEAQAQLATAQTNLSKATIYSPVTGVVLARDIDPGQTVAASFQAPVLFTIAQDLSQMKLEVKVDEADVGQVKAGQRATFTVDAYPGRSFDAVIDRVDVGSSSSTSSSSSSGNSVVSYTAVLLVKNPDLALRPGMTATADIVTAQKRNVLLIPNSALRFKPSGGAGEKGVAGIFGPPSVSSAQQAAIGRGSRQTVYVLDANNQPSPRSVVVGDSNGSMTEILSGQLKAGDKVVTGQLATGGKSGGAPQGSSFTPLVAILPRRRRTRRKTRRG
jgi:HlyD family secretion protein